MPKVYVSLSKKLIYGFTSFIHRSRDLIKANAIDLQPRSFVLLCKTNNYCKRLKVIYLSHRLLKALKSLR